MKKFTSIGGSTAYSMCMVAKGAFSNYIARFESNVSAWDLSAACLIIRNMGDFVTDLDDNNILTYELNIDFALSDKVSL